jgi:hypothetical protein
MAPHVRSGGHDSIPLVFAFQSIVKGTVHPDIFKSAELERVGTQLLANPDLHRSELLPHVHVYSLPSLTALTNRCIFPVVPDL